MPKTKKAQLQQAGGTTAEFLQTALALVSRSNPASLPRQLAQSALRLPGVDLVLVFLEENDLLRLCAAAPASDAPRKRPPLPRADFPFLYRALATRGSHAPLLFSLNDLSPAEKNLLPSGGWQSLMALPLRHGGQTPGLVLLARSGPLPDFSADDTSLYQSFAELAAFAVGQTRSAPARRLKISR